uniref:Uncharacterized protein n=1 Tax=Utricularia reniformis TaxID=192314 RepID=A0A1Y0B2C8_9LAMI|nr:hypothetical protein AEK19_MT1401 [Utricularia reniformis]ART31596.1 hypothetical protein AEK19_MT1401 [Utricularia reniformis]
MSLSRSSILKPGTMTMTLYDLAAFTWLRTSHLTTDAMNIAVTRYQTRLDPSLISRGAVSIPPLRRILEGGRKGNERTNRDSPIGIGVRFLFD